MALNHVSKYLQIFFSPRWKNFVCSYFDVGVDGVHVDSCRHDPRLFGNHSNARYLLHVRYDWDGPYDVRHVLLSQAPF